MTKHINIYIMLLLCFSSVTFAELIDIPDDMQKNIQSNTTSIPQPALNSGSSQNPVNTNDAELMTDIIDIKPLEKIGYDKRIIKYGVMILFLLLVVCLLIYLIDYFIRRRNKEVTEEVIVIPADVEAFKLLDDLQRENNLDAREYYFRLTAILRGYIGKRFEIDAPEMTTEELLPKLNELSCEKKLIIDIKSVLTSTDPVKYAGADAVKNKMETDFQIVKDFVRLTPLVLADSEGEKKDV